jgi:uncharacterized protein YjiK
MKLLTGAAALLVASSQTTCRAADGTRAARSDSAELEARATRLAEAMNRPDSGQSTDTPVARWILPRNLREISGLVLTPDGRLLAHGDEHARVFEVDYRKGVIVKHFGVGQPDVPGDFEAIAYAHDQIHLMTSNGMIYSFREGKDGEHVDYTTLDTKLGRECEFESMTYDPAIESLVLACKHVYLKGLKKSSLVFYRVKLDPKAPDRISQLTVPAEPIIGSNPWKVLNPSDLTIDPKTGNYVMVASLQKALLVITPDGKPVSAGRIPGTHPQAEGVAITKDGILIVSDEAGRGGGDAVITLYKWS